MSYTDEIGLQISRENLSTRSSHDSSSNESEVEFTDVIEKLHFAIDNVRQLKPWKDRALKAERSNRHLNSTIARLKSELSDTNYELQKWKKRAVRAEKENQDEVQKWKQQALQARSGINAGINESDDEDINDIDLLRVHDSNSFTNLASERDDDESTISTFRDESKSVREVTGNSFRNKWNNLVIQEEQINPAESVHEQDENSTIAAQELIHRYERNLYNHGVPDESSTVAAEEIMHNYEKGLFGPSKSQQDDSSAGAAEEILNNYLNMKVKSSERSCFISLFLQIYFD